MVTETIEFVNGDEYSLQTRAFLRALAGAAYDEEWNSIEKVENENSLFTVTFSDFSHDTVLPWDMFTKGYVCVDVAFDAETITFKRERDMDDAAHFKDGNNARSEKQDARMRELGITSGDR